MDPNLNDCDLCKKILQKSRVIKMSSCDHHLHLSCYTRSVKNFIIIDEEEEEERCPICVNNNYHNIQLPNNDIDNTKNTSISLAPLPSQPNVSENTEVNKSNNSYINYPNCNKYDDDNDEECCICFEPKYKHEMLVTPNCDHSFHMKCLCEWFKQNQDINYCPSCKTILSLEVLGLITDYENNYPPSSTSVSNVSNIHIPEWVKSSDVTKTPDRRDVNLNNINDSSNVFIRRSSQPISQVYANNSGVTVHSDGVYHHYPKGTNISFYNNKPFPSPSMSSSYSNNIVDSFNGDGISVFSDGGNNVVYNGKQKLTSNTSTKYNTDIKISGTNINQDYDYKVLNDFNSTRRFKISGTNIVVKIYIPDKHQFGHNISISGCNNILFLHLPSTCAVQNIRISGVNTKLRVNKEASENLYNCKLSGINCCIERV